MSLVLSLSKDWWANWGCSRSFAGNHPRYGNEEFIEMVDTSRINIPEGIDFLTWYGPRSNDEDKAKGKEKEVGTETEKDKETAPNRTEVASN